MVISEELANMDSVRKTIRSAISKSLYSFDVKHPRIPLNVPTFDEEEILDALDSLVSTKVTMGEKVFAFEKAFASYIGVKNAVMVNSGSSANLIALSVLANPAVVDYAKPGFEAILPAVTWSTSVFPVHNVQGIPVLTDVLKDTFNIDPSNVAKAFSKKSKAIIAVHLLGNPADMKAILKLAHEESLKVVEDCCEAHGAEIAGKKVGQFGDVSTFSFFFSHHITTIEGGVVLTDNDVYAEVARSLRAHGWIREMKARESYVKKYPAIDPRFLFVNLGYNFRPTEIQGAFGIHQLKKLERFIDVRRKNAAFFEKQLAGYSNFIELQFERSGTRHVWFGYPITVKNTAPFTAKALRSFLELKGIETRPIMGGNLAEQPAFRLFEHRIVGKLPNSRRIMRRSFFFGNHHGIDSSAREYIVSCFEEFFGSDLYKRT